MQQKGSGMVALPRLAWRNLWRHRRRTLLLVLVVAYATITTILFWGVQDGFTQSVQLGNARFLSAPALITTPQYFEDPDPEQGLPSLDFLPQVQAQPGVNAAAPRLEFPALIRSAYTADAARARGVDPVLEARVSNLPAAIATGRMLEKPGEVVLGHQLAERLDVRLGERVVLDTSALAGPQALGLQVVGLVKSGIAPVDRGTVLVHLQDARVLTGLQTATGVALDVARGQETRIAEALQPVLPQNIRAYDLTQLLGGLSSAIGTKQSSVFLIGMIFSLFAALAVTSTVLVSVLERTREFGMMGALGMTPPRLAAMVTLETVLATSIGWGVGLGVGYALNHWMATQNVLGPIFASYGAAWEILGTGGEIYTAQSPLYALYAALTIVLAALFSILIPARRVLLLNPAEAMRTD
ncbi:MAG: FtsX-like permease family protein [Meiothermus sp.]|uniref:ABC transporter permease n=1 Tax=Meiothermus sp. TaxID=1955249 RepID=UPI0025FBF336|nr:FtsX-like permease family protein [Meiothermus sp.]MCS7068726.1 ABC transporter permease [Meiothermus sp.]MDW8425126.1 FtsX-like permease family protein [Meiothermus sp.]